MQTVTRSKRRWPTDRLQLKIALSAPPISATEFLMMMLPLLMWIFAAAIAWVLVNWLLLRPLARMQRAVAAYQPGDTELEMPAFKTPAREIGELGGAFNRVTQTVARHEAELEAAVERQTKLVREVHHRVKNNLQVVASLLNLHSRGSPNEEVAAAYASIQRRVDALAVVHRNHYAELEENRGVSLRSLISELGANLRATAPASAGNMADPARYRALLCQSGRGGFGRLSGDGNRRIRDVLRRARRSPSHSPAKTRSDGKSTARLSVQIRCPKERTSCATRCWPNGSTASSPACPANCAPRSSGTRKKGGTRWTSQSWTKPSRLTRRGSSAQSGRPRPSSSSL